MKQRFIDKFGEVVCEIVDSQIVRPIFCVIGFLVVVVDAAVETVRDYARRI